jgi:phosphate transport system protein|uniref:phosphate signaling complex protein PhoU n=1 Tax=Candidatus Planktophila sp. TaxID=2175601 RepID=UPI004049E821
MPLIRSVFQDELDSVSQTLFELSVMVSDSMAKATNALMTKNLSIAEEVISYDEKIDTVQHDLDGRIIDIIARQQPVASDLRALVTALRMSADLERMGDLADHVAKVVRLRHPASAVPDQLLSLIESMGVTAEKIAAKTGVVISTRDTVLAAQLEKDDDEMDLLHRQLISALIAPTWEHGVETAIDLTLLGRYYERYADHAVSVARRVIFLVTGKFA